MAHIPDLLALRCLVIIFETYAAGRSSVYGSGVIKIKLVWFYSCHNAAHCHYSGIGRLFTSDDRARRQLGNTGGYALVYSHHSMRSMLTSNNSSVSSASCRVLHPWWFLFSGPFPLNVHGRFCLLRNFFQWGVAVLRPPLFEYIIVWTVHFFKKTAYNNLCCEHWDGSYCLRP